MARRRVSSVEEDFRRSIYGNADPHKCGNIWLENGAYDRLNRELAYYRLHPQNADPEALIRLIDEIQSAWNADREAYREHMTHVLTFLENAFDEMREREKDYEKLRKLTVRLRKDLDEQMEKQRELERKLSELQQIREQDESQAETLSKMALEELSTVAGDPYFAKYAQEDLLWLESQERYLVEEGLAPAARQALAASILARVYSSRQIVERKRLAFKEAQLLALTEADRILEQFEHWRTQVYFDPGRQHKADMDWWSFGDFSREYGRAKMFADRIRGGELVADYMIADVQDDLRHIEECQREGEKIVEAVFNTCNLSEECEQLGLLCAMVLCEDFHFRLVASGFDDGDNRMAYVIQMENVTGDIKLQMVFTPVSQTQSVGTYQVSFREYTDERMLRSFQGHVETELHENGLNARWQSAGNSPHGAEVVEDIPFAAKGEPIRLPESMKVKQH